MTLTDISELPDGAPTDGFTPIPVTQAHRAQAASTLGEIGSQVTTWIKTGGVAPRGGPLNDQLIDVAKAFSQLDHEISQRFQDQVDTLTAELAETKAGYHALDKNWETMHEAAMGPIRSALDLPDGSVLEIVTAIETLKQAHTNPHTCVAVGVNGERYCTVCGKSMPDPPPLHVFWDEDSIWVVAIDCEDAALVYAQYLGDGDPTFDTLQFSRCPDEQSIRIKMYFRGPHVDEIAPADEESEDIETVTKLAREWAERQPRGFLCATDF